MNKILKKLEELVKEGLPISTVRAEYKENQRWRVVFSIPLMLPLGEGDGTAGRYMVTLPEKTEGTNLSGWERHPDENLFLEGINEEAMEAMIAEVASIGEAIDYARFEGKDGYLHLVTKPNKWMPELKPGWKIPKRKQ